MDEDGGVVSDNPRRSRLVLPSLVVTRFALGAPSLLISLLLIEIGATFGQSVGATGQISTVSSVAAFVAALLMGFLSIRFRPKPLMLIGMSLFTLSAVGCAFSPQFSLMVAFYAMGGLGASMVIPMTTTMVGELYPLSERATVIGYLLAGGALSFVIGAPSIILIAGYGGWRTAFLGFVLPIVLLGTLLSYLGLPSNPSGEGTSTGGRGFVEGFRDVLMNSSAVACLLGSALNAACWQAVVFYSASFMRQRFQVSTGFASMYIIGGALSYTVGSLVSGRFVNRFGRKRVTVITSILAGAFTLLYYNVLDIWASIFLAYVASLFTGVRSSSSSSLTMEQIPSYRGTMMSISSAIDNMGVALGAGLGGLMLLWYDYNVLGVVLGGAGVAASLLFQLLTRDPTEKKRG
ncbi:MFS transporter [Candidatus Bathyarchaeota archaeon]|nr:MFS transporter [Candidatus Bathyarchaeota archaeon]